MHVSVSSKGAVKLGDNVACDGFLSDCRVRVQTHTHIDHMNQFTSSLGTQHILMTPATRDLLIAELNGAFPYHENVIAVDTGSITSKDGCEILLLENGHMLGSAQVAVTLSDGTRCGYSGDFSWPLDEVIAVDELVVDTTYGSPDSVRRFTEEEANMLFVELVNSRLPAGPISVTAHRGTLQRALTCLDGSLRCPILAKPAIYKEVEVYREWGYSLTQVIPLTSPEATEARKSGRYVLVDGISRKASDLSPCKTSVVLSAFWGSKTYPLTQYSERAYNIALSGHADYTGTMEYIKATGAGKVLTDSTRGGHAVELALAIQRELGIQAQASQVEHTSQWGR